MTSLSRPAGLVQSSPSRKSPDFAAIGAGSPIARRKVAGMCVSAALLLILAPGCLMPQSVDPQNTRPHTIPRVDLKTLPDYLLKPQMLLYPRGPSDPTSCSCVLEINLNIIADDPTVNVQGRLFVDYDLSVPTSQRRVDTRDLEGSFQSPETTRPVQLTINADQFGLTPGPGPAGVHVFEFVLAEQAGFAADTVSPPQRATKPDFESSILKFTVVVQPQDPLRPTCDVQAIPPQKRHCSP